MMEAIVLGIATALGGDFALHRVRERVSPTELPRLRRLSDEMRRNEIYPFEQ